MADVHDVSGRGTEKTYGHGFYTKGKRLIFYAFDLDAQPGVQSASSFQAWGRKRPDKQQAHSLGTFYEDNVSKKCLVLKADDPKSLEDIGAVFVTVEPNGGSQYPSGSGVQSVALGVAALAEQPRSWPPSMQRRVKWSSPSNFTALFFTSHFNVDRMASAYERLPIHDFQSRK